PLLCVAITSSTPGQSTLTFVITSFESKLREAWLNSTSCRRIISSRTYSLKHYHDNDLNSYSRVLVKEKQEKDKIGSKPDKNGKRGEAGKILKQMQLKEEEKPKKTKKEWPKTHTQIKSYATLKKRRKEKGHKCNSSKVQPQGPVLPTA
nr:hypothetical protein [Tanacetum cinerariifolium]